MLVIIVLFCDLQNETAHKKKTKLRMRKKLFGDFGLDLSCLWYRTINNLSQIYSRSIFEMHTAPGTCLLYAPGAVSFSNMILEHV